VIVVDAFSTDNTLKILEKYQKKHNNIKVIQEGGTRATARQTGIKQIETDWFMFVDSDVELCDKWFEKAQPYISDKVGAIWGIEVWSVINNPEILKMFLWITRKIFELRGGTHDTLIRRKAISGIRIPETLHVFEDAYIKNWIIQKGYSVIACYDPYCLHFRSKTVWTLKGSIQLIIDAIKYGSLTMLSKLLLAYGFYAGFMIRQLLFSRTKRSNH
jgi:glycosyltransferase involved in cell wall biosynthesis